MNRLWLLPVVQGAAIAFFIAATYGLLYFSIYSFLGADVVLGPFGPASILMVLVAAPGIPLLRSIVSDRLDRHRLYLLIRWALMIVYLIVGVPVALGLIEYAGPFNFMAILFGAALSLVFFVVASAVAFPLYLFSSGVLRAKPGFVHAGAFAGLSFFPLTTLRIFLQGSEDFGLLLQGWLILTGFLVAWEWGDMASKLSRTIAPFRGRLVHNPVEAGLYAYLPTGLVWYLSAFGLTLFLKDWLVDRRFLGGPESSWHVFFWIGMLVISVVLLGFLTRFGTRRADPAAASTSAS